jgi:LemA protein
MKKIYDKIQGMKKTILIIAGIVVVLLLIGVSIYNNVVGLNTSVDGQWAQVETQYQRRLDLIPNLVESVKGVMNQEQEVFGAIAEARTRYANAGTPEDRAAAATAVEGSLARLLAVMENYPQLKSADTVNTLMAQLEGTENRVSVERKRYNDLVQEYNATIKRIPTNIFAGIFGFDARNYFEADEAAATAPPQVTF